MVHDFFCAPKGHSHDASWPHVGAPCNIYMHPPPSGTSAVSVVSENSGAIDASGVSYLSSVSDGSGLSAGSGVSE